MIALDAPTVVPGHGPVTDPDGIRGVPGDLVHVAEQAEAAYRKGLSWSEAADTIDLGEYATWLDAERVVVNVYQRYRGHDHPHATRILAWLHIIWHCWQTNTLYQPTCHHALQTLLTQQHQAIT
jgi:hypothetical protein